MSLNRRHEDQGPVGWLRRPPTNLSVAVLFLSICLLFGLIAASFTLNSSRISSDEHATCIIQQRGLPAGHELAASMRGIYALLTLKPTSAAQKLAAKNRPAEVTRTIAALDGHLSAYLAAEAKQPRTRGCP